jgi:hypothetical protein
MRPVGGGTLKLNCMIERRFPRVVLILGIGAKSDQGCHCVGTDHRILDGMMEQRPALGIREMEISAETSEL